MLHKKIKFNNVNETNCLKSMRPVSDKWAGSNTVMKYFAVSIWKNVLISEVKIKSSYKTIFYGLEKT